ncbi:MAG: hypothetical protein AB1428_12765 [Bacteroidota bacterium]
MNRLLKHLLVGTVVVLMASCAGLKLDRVDFGWPVESMLTVDNNSMIEDVRYGVIAGVGGLAMEEFRDSTALRGTNVRLLRSGAGYYFLTGPRFKHVYVFAAGEHSLTLNSAILVSENGLKDPALNQRPPYVELIDGDGFRCLLTADDIVEARK